MVLVEAPHDRLQHDARDWVFVGDRLVDDPHALLLRVALEERGDPWVARQAARIQ
jgi:hypothetical protein